jgi:deoxyribonuclease-4
MKLGLHISIEGGVDKAPGRAQAAGCECFQIFSRSPHGGPSKKVGAPEAAAFRAARKELGLGHCYLHCPYYINFAAENNRVYYGSIGAVRAELETADLLGARAVVTHLGSAKDLGDDAGAKLVEGLVKVFELPQGGNKKAAYKKYKAKLLLEITAGSGNILGDTFEEIATFIRGAEKQLGQDTLGVCFDTAHAFASGYDLSTPAAVADTFRRFDETVGLPRIKLVHLNDSLAALDSHMDRHANIGKGKIGLEGIRSILAELRSRRLDFVLETPLPGNVQDLALLKEVRSAF